MFNSFSYIDIDNVDDKMDTDQTMHNPDWSFSSSFLYSLSLITTMGKHIFEQIDYLIYYQELRNMFFTQYIVHYITKQVNSPPSKTILHWIAICESTLAIIQKGFFSNMQYPLGSWPSLLPRRFKVIYFCPAKSNVGLVILLQTKIHSPFSSILFAHIHFPKFLPY